MRCCSGDRAASRRGRTRSRSRPSPVIRTCFRPRRPRRRRSSVRSSGGGRRTGATRGAHANTLPLLPRFKGIAAEVARRPLSFDDWHVVYRQVLQLGRALGGGRQILEVTLPKESFMASARFNAPIDSATQSLSTRQLLTQLIETVTLLVRKEAE